MQLQKGYLFYVSEFKKIQIDFVFIFSRPFIIEQLTSFFGIKEEPISLSDETEEQSNRFIYQRHSKAEYTPPRPEGKPYFQRHYYEDVGTFCCEEVDFNPVILSFKVINLKKKKKKITILKGRIL